MNRWIATSSLFVIMVLGFPGAAFGQESSDDAGIEPEEPLLILPDVVIQVSDIQRTEVVGGLPEEDAVLAREAEIPLPEADLIVDIEPILALPSETVYRYEEVPFHASVQLGLGMINHLLGDITLYKTGEKPRFKLGFQHQQMDDFSIAGAPYSFREELFTTNAKLDAIGFAVDLEGEYHEQEQGLQGQGSGGTRVMRRIRGQLDLAQSWNELFHLSLSTLGQFSTSLLTGASLEQEGEILLLPKVVFELGSPSFRIGWDVEYAFSSLQFFTPPGSLSHRIRADAYLHWDLPFGMSVFAAAGYQWNSLYTHWGRIPFDLGLSANLAKILYFRLSGGYRVSSLYAGDLLFAFPYSYLTAPPGDSAGWFGEAQLSARIGSRWAFHGDLTYEEPSTLLAPDSAVSPLLGLFPFTSQSASRLTLDSGLRWGWEGRLGLAVHWLLEILPVPEQLPTDSLTVEAEWSGRNQRLKLEAGVVFEDLFEKSFLLPALDIAASARLGTSAVLKVQGQDLLRFLSGSPYYTVSGSPYYPRQPFAGPGSRLSVVLAIDF